VVKEGIQTSPQIKSDSVCFLKISALQQCKCNYSTDVYYCGVCLNVPTFPVPRLFHLLSVIFIKSTVLAEHSEDF